METRLVAATPNAEELILYIARVSSDQDKWSTGLIRYLIENGHWSPFEMAHATWEIQTSRTIGRQILRHRSFSFQEFSQRYAEHPATTEKYQARRAGSSNRQGSIDDLPYDSQAWFQQAQDDVERFTQEQYRRAVSQGIATESARFLLPETASTKLYMAGSLRSWIHYLGDGPGGRTNPHTQREHYDIAMSIRATFCVHFPIIADALGWREHDDD